MTYKILITTSGTGSRLGELTKDINKALVPINGKETIRYIIDAYPIGVPIVITLGYLGEQMKDFLLKTYLERQFEFVTVDKYVGEGSSLGYSMLCARKNLQCPFIFHACDTIVVEPIPEPNKNWIAGFAVDEHNSDLPLKEYRTHKVINGKVLKLNDKGVPDFQSIHIGFDGIKDYEVFWKALEDLYNQDQNFSQLCDTQVLSRMLDLGVEFEWIPYKVWLDTGNLEAFKKTENYLKTHARK